MNDLTTWTITLHAWWLLTYLAVGIALFPILQWKAARDTYPRRTGRAVFWEQLRRHKGLNIVVGVTAWPLGVWEVFA